MCRDYADTHPRQMRLKEKALVHRVGCQAKPLPAGRSVARVPGNALIMPNTGWQMIGVIAHSTSLIPTRHAA
jgi:hypothetical protein